HLAQKSTTNTLPLWALINFLNTFAADVFGKVYPVFFNSRIVYRRSTSVLKTGSSTVRKKSSVCFNKTLSTWINSKLLLSSRSCMIRYIKGKWSVRYIFLKFCAFRSAASSISTYEILYKGENSMRLIKVEKS